jgi:hypothetical protein
MTGSSASVPQLGRLDVVSARDIWAREDYHFTPWLLSNADVLGQLLGMDLELETAEHPVGDFFLDLVGTDTATGEKVIVENQLEASDHTHLGQILTYAGGTDPVNIVWIATRFREEHRAALDWLNTRTDESTRFFAVEVSVVRIGASEPAPLMRLIAAPNDWGKSVRAATSKSIVGSEKSQLYQQFWQRYLDRLRADGLQWTKATRPPPDNWVSLTAGVAGVSFGTVLGKRGLQTELFLGNPDPAINTKNFEALRERQGELEAAFGAPLEWEDLPGKKGCRVAFYSPGTIDDTAAWDSYLDWFIDTQSRLRAAIDAMGGLISIFRAADEPPAAAQGASIPPTAP